jgi:hypothetical protein
VGDSAQFWKSLNNYLNQSQILGGDFNKRGAMYIFSIYWFFIDKETYDSPLFAYAVRIAFLVINIYYFFLRQDGLRVCLKNLFSALNFREAKFTLRKRQQTIEVFVTAFIACINCAPGGHFQF